MSADAETSPLSRCGNRRRRGASRSAWLLLLTLLSPFALATEDGVTADKILIGQTAGQTGLVASQVAELNAAARAYFAYINKRGGVHGRSIEMVTLDDGRDAKRAAENARKLITVQKVFMLALPRSTPTSEALLPIVRDFQVPLVGPSTGALSVHQPFNRYVFNVRAKYQTEAAQIIDHLARIGIQRIAVVHQNDSFGKDVLGGFEEGFKAKNLKAVAIVPLDGAKPEISVAGAVETLCKIDPQAVVIGGPLKATADMIKALKAKGVFAQYFTVSNLSADAFIKELGPAAPGVVVSQVMPAPTRIAMPLVKEYQIAMKENPGLGAVSSYTAMEGLVTAKVIVEALRRAGATPTREGMVRALESLQDFDLGGYIVNFSRSNHSGSSFIDITIITKDGTFRG